MSSIEIPTFPKIAARTFANGSAELARDTVMIVNQGDPAMVDRQLGSGSLRPTAAACMAAAGSREL